jgi:hypothetical protein
VDEPHCMHVSSHSEADEPLRLRMTDGGQAGSLFCGAYMLGDDDISQLQAY